MNFINVDRRSKTLYSNIIMSFGLRIVNILIGFLLIPLLISTLTKYEYGIWLALANMVNWINYFDVGLGNGLKNKLGEALAQKDYEKGKLYVSTTYFALIIFSVIIYLLFVVSFRNIDYYKTLNIEKSFIPNLKSLMNIIVLSTLLNFVTKLIDNILLAQQKTALTTFKLTFSQLIVLFYLYSLTYYKTSDVLLYAVIGLTLIPVFCNVVFSLYYFLFNSPQLKPSYNYAKLKYLNSLFTLGSKFFIIQIGVLIMFQTQSFILLKILGANAVTEYNIAYKFYTILYMLLSIIMVPFWSGVIEAYNKGDFRWLKTKTREILVIFLFLTVATNCILYFFDDFLLKLWLQKEFYISPDLRTSLILYSIVLSLLTISMNFINGVGKLSVQLALYIICSIINIPLSIYLCKTIGISGVVISNIILFSIMNIFLWKQVNLILKNKTYGIWKK